ncbi:MAG: hypothetical protein O3B86_03295 [Planctomycetota bacterium]|nr:hypothetical protein [Planctomycetota bacterium]
MSQEILYTSAPKGLKPGSRGFCTVVSTRGMPQPLADRLESLSGYRHAWPPHDPQSSQNPVNYSHLSIVVGGNRYHILSRVADYGEDYTQRSNKLAHHVALDETELVPCGPAWVLYSPGFCETMWDEQTAILPAGRKPPSDMRLEADYSAWREHAGDAGWAGVLAAAAMDGSKRPVSVIFAPGTPTLDLVEQALNLVPHEKRWDVTFSTYFTRLPAGVDCRWRFILDGTPDANALRSNPHATSVIDLVNLSGSPPESDAVVAARDNRQPVHKPPAESARAPKPALRKAAPDLEFAGFEEAVDPDAADDTADGTYGVLPPERTSQSETSLALGTSHSGTPPRGLSRDRRAERPDGSSHKGLLIAAGLTIALLLTTVIAGGIWILHNPVSPPDDNQQLAHNDTLPDHAAASPTTTEDSALDQQQTSREGSSGQGGNTDGDATGGGVRATAGIPEPSETGHSGNNGSGEPQVEKGSASGEGPEGDPVPSRPTPQPQKPLIAAKSTEMLDLGAPNFAVLGEGTIQLLGEFQVKPDECRLKLLGTESVALGFELRLEERVESDDNLKWPVVFVKEGQGEPIKIGSLLAVGREFKFEWSKGHVEEQANALRKCLLIVSRNDQEEAFRLGVSDTFPAPVISLRSATAAGNRIPVEKLPPAILESELLWGNWALKPGPGGFKLDLPGGHRPLDEPAEFVVHAEGKKLATFTATLGMTKENQLQLVFVMRARLYDFDKFLKNAQDGKDPKLIDELWHHLGLELTKKRIERIEEIVQGVSGPPGGGGKGKEKSILDEVPINAGEKPKDKHPNPAILDKWKSAKVDHIWRLNKLGELTDLLHEKARLSFDILYEVELPAGGKRQVVLHKGSIAGERIE